jgi:hypothetical protein
MRLTRSGLVIVLTALFLSGCGDGRFKAKGRVVRKGAPFTMAEGEGMRMTFVPVEAGEKTFDTYAVVYNKDGSFEVIGKDGKGLPPGKYRIGLEHLKQKQDLLEGAFAAANTPIIREVTNTSGEIVIDLDNPTAE